MLFVSFGRPASWNGGKLTSFANTPMLEVVAQPEIQRQAIRDLPVVLRPAGDLLRVEVDVEVADADAVAPRDRRDRREVPGVGVERIREERFDVGRHRPVGGVNRAHALPAVRLNLMTVQELAAELQVVMAARVVRVREVVAHVPDPLVLVPRIELVAADREAGERDAGRPGRDAVGRLPVLRPRREVRVGETEHGLPHPDLVQRPVAQDLRELPEVLVVVFVVGPGRRRMALKIGRREKRLEEPARRELPHHARLRRQLIVETHAALLLVVGAGQRDVERRVRRVPDAGPRLALVFVVGEVVQLVLDDRAAKRRAELLVVDGLDAVQDRILRR